MREKSATVLLWGHAILWVWVIPLLRQYLIYSGIVFNVCVILILFWR